VVDVEQRALRALEQNAFTLAPLGVEQRPYRIHIRQHLRRDRSEMLVDRGAIELGHAETAAQRIVMRQQAVDLGRQRRQIGEIHEADGAAADFVFVSRTDAALGGADAGLGIVGFADRFQFAMQRQNQNRIFGDAQIVGRDRHALLLELADLDEQRLRVDHHAVADHRQLAAAHHAGRQQRQLVDLAVDNQRVAGIVAALEPDHDVGLFRQPVDDLAFTLVAPLGADNHHIRHENVFSASAFGH